MDLIIGLILHSSSLNDFEMKQKFVRKPKLPWAHIATQLSEVDGASVRVLISLSLLLLQLAMGGGNGCG